MNVNISIARQDFAPSTAPILRATRNYRLLGNLVLALTLVGYPLVAAVSQLTGFESGELSAVFRMVVIVLAVVLLVWSVGRGRYRIDPLITLFFALYSVRLMLDLNYSFLPDIEKDSQFFVAVVLIPTLAMGGVRDWFNEKILLCLTLAIGGFGGLLVAVVLRTSTSLAILPQNYVERARLDFLNPISIGYHGLFISVAAIILLAKHRSRALLIPCIITSALGAYLLVVSASRGPFVALALGLALTGAANRRARVTYVPVAIIVAGIFGYFGLPEGVLARFQDIGDTSAQERIYATQLSIDAALANPLFGYAYVEPITGLYPHNVLVEAGLAMGMIGFVLMAWMQVSLLWNAWRHAQQGEWAVPFLACAMIANAWISGAIWGSALLFMLVWLLRETPVRITKVSSQARLPGAGV